MTPEQWALVTSHRGYARSLARPYLAAYPGMREALHDALLDGLCDAARNYVPGRWTFATFATPRIRGALVDQVRREYRKLRPGPRPGCRRRRNGTIYEPSRAARPDDDGFERLVACAPKRCREVLVLYYREGLNEPEIARRRGCSKHTVWLQHKEALRELAFLDGAALARYGVDLPKGHAG